MKKYLIEAAKCGVTGGGIACGPVFGEAIATVKFNDGGESKWLTLVEVDVLSCYLSTEDIYDIFMAGELDDATIEHVNCFHISSFEGIRLNGEYYETFYDIFDSENKSATSLVRFLISIIRNGDDDAEVVKMINSAINKNSDEVEIIPSDVEEETLAEFEE